MTQEPTPSLTDSLLRCKKEEDCTHDLRALGLAGVCTIRPHYRLDHGLDAAADIYERVQSVTVARIPNGEGMM